MHSNDYFPEYLISVFKQLLFLRLHKDSQKFSTISFSFLSLSHRVFLSALHLTEVLLACSKIQDNY